MTAKCGTLGAYKRHVRKKEPVDGPCQMVGDAYNESRRKAPRESDGSNAYCRQMDKALEKNPPVIVWRRNSRGVLVHVFIDDPHAETKSEVRRDLKVHYYEDPDRLIAEQRAVQLGLQAAESIKDRTRNTSLMSAARTDI